MRHRVAGRKLGRTSAHRLALMRNLSVELFRHERIRTTIHKAKELRSFAEKLITQAKQDTVHALGRSGLQALWRIIGTGSSERGDVVLTGESATCAHRASQSASRSAIVQLLTRLPYEAGSVPNNRFAYGSARVH